VAYARDPYDAAAGCDALLILTEWKEFANLDLRKIRSLLKHPIVIDGRNLYSPQQMTAAGLIHYSVGRSVGVPEPVSSLVACHDSAASRPPLRDVLGPRSGEIFRWLRRQVLFSTKTPAESGQCPAARSVCTHGKYTITDWSSAAPYREPGSQHSYSVKEDADAYAPCPNED